MPRSAGERTPFRSNAAFAQQTPSFAAANDGLRCLLDGFARRGHHKAPGLHALRAKDFVRDILHKARFALQDDNFQAVMLIQMYMHVETMNSK